MMGTIKKIIMDKQQAFQSYIDYLYSPSTNKSYDYIGRYIKIVKRFLDSEYPVSMTGYKQYMRKNAILVIDDPLTKEALCDFLWTIGKNTSRKRRMETVKPLEKLSKISERNKKLINDFIYYLTQEEDYSSHTLDTYVFAVRKYFEYANEVSVDNYKRFVRLLEEEGLAPQTIRLRITALERFAKFVRKPIELKRPKFSRKLETDNIPTKGEYERLLEYLKAQPNKDGYYFIRILASTGARISEFLQFKWEDILNGEVTLKGKGNKYRRFFFSKQLREEVKAYVKDSGKNGYIAIGKYGRISTRGFDQKLKAWGKKCGIDKKKMHAHAFRHFFAKMFLEKNKDVIQLADLMGHENIDTTRIYLQKSYEEKKKEFNRSVTW